jgi:hypothetical protein
MVAATCVPLLHPLTLGLPFEDAEVDGDTLSPGEWEGDTLTEEVTVPPPPPAPSPPPPLKVGKAEEVRVPAAGEAVGTTLFVGALGLGVEEGDTSAEAVSLREVVRMPLGVEVTLGLPEGLEEGVDPVDSVPPPPSPPERMDGDDPGLREPLSVALAPLDAEGAPGEGDSERDREGEALDETVFSLLVEGEEEGMVEVEGVAPTPCDGVAPNEVEPMGDPLTVPCPLPVAPQIGDWEALVDMEVQGVKEDARDALGEEDTRQGEGVSSPWEEVTLPLTPALLVPPPEVTVGVTEVPGLPLPSTDAVAVSEPPGV